MIKQIVDPNGVISDKNTRHFIASGLGMLPLKDKRVLVIVPDNTRTMPLAMIYKVITETLEDITASLDFMVALGTHPPLDDHQLSRLFGQEVRRNQIGKHKIFNHEWHNPAMLREVGVISGEKMVMLSEGRLSAPLPVRVNRHLFEYDHLIIFGPVFPHEVAGFSGGNKYFFPGVSGSEMIDATHWLGACLTNLAVNGAGYTPVRAVIDEAASMIHLPKTCFALVLDKTGIAGIYSGTPEEAWQAASELSAERHIARTGRTYKKVIAILPEMYQELWVGGKGMYKLEPVVADGGEIILYAPHLKTISATHGKIIMEIGYHVLDYFQMQWERFKHYPPCVLAHSTHVRGLGIYNERTQQEYPRISVTLATGIPEEVCRRINLGYMDPTGIDIGEWVGREDEGILVVRDAGETLFKVK